MNEYTITKRNAEFKRNDSSGCATGAAKTENEIATLILDCAVELHRKLGPGLLESAYEASLMHHAICQQGGCGDA